MVVAVAAAIVTAVIIIWLLKVFIRVGIVVATITAVTVNDFNVMAIALKLVVIKQQ